MPELPRPIIGGPAAPQPVEERDAPPAPPAPPASPERGSSAWPMRMLLALILGAGVLALFAYGPWPRVGWGWMAFWGVLAAALLFGLATLFGNVRSRGAKRIS